ncbi:MAG: GTP-binding protein [Candidatus Lokiarchaeota archaeon]|nr:GTP-binding protein [Candidatus Lokiarchaeota archaeon]
MEDEMETASNKRILKIAFTGLDNAGKTSILNVLEKQYSKLSSTKPTTGVERRSINVLGYRIVNWDLGGQEKYRDDYLDEEARVFEGTDLLFYVVDISSRERFYEALEYYKNVLWEVFESKKSETIPFIVICLHKYDPDLQDDELVSENIELARNLFEENSKDYDIKFFLTSIFDDWSILKAFSFGIQRLSSKLEILEKLLAAFAAETYSDALLLLDGSALPIGEFYSNKLSSDIINILAPNFAPIYEKLSKMNIDIDKIWTEFGGKYSLFTRIEVNNQPYFIIIVTLKENVYDILNKLDAFSDTLGNVLKTFF